MFKTMFKKKANVCDNKAVNDTLRNLKQMWRNSEVKKQKQLFKNNKNINV